MGRVLSDKRVTGARFVVFELEPRSDGTAQQGEAAACDQACSLPDVLRDHQLWSVTSREIGAEGDEPGGAVRPELQLLNRIANIKMEYLVGSQAM